MNNKTIVLYHADCSDGFGGAFAAYKKFGGGADYLAVKHQTPPPENLAGKEVYIIDFSYPKEISTKIAAEAPLTIIDHHKSAEEAVKSAPRYVFDLKHSGCVLAWHYFHPEKPAPKLLSYVEDGDLWKFELPNSRELQCVINIADFDFAVWEKLGADFENEEMLAALVKKGKIILEYRKKLFEIFVDSAEEAEFEGYRVLAANVPPMFKSDVGNILAKKKPPFAIVWHYDSVEDRFNFSLRSDGSVDVSKIASRYGGGGHPAAASFKLKLDVKFPWEKI